MSPLLDYLRPGAAKGDANVDQRLDAFAERYRQFFPRVFAYVYGRVQDVCLAEDLVSEVFERALLKANSLRNEDAFGTWLFTIARNVVTSHGRRRAREQTAPDSEMLASIASSSASVESQILQQEEVATLLRYVLRLSQREQEILALKFDAELSNQQIARVMGLNETNVRVILFRSLRKLRDMMLAEKALASKPKP